jgi:hypothetical protein
MGMVPHSLHHPENSIIIHVSQNLRKIEKFETSSQKSTRDALRLRNDILRAS